ncbi:hypothetical protein [Falsiroseomonas sp.]|uniref:hypothetical protein n=1 Tax=Falsiroseomonas sp. TaxID=2870721 RepID=UPI0034A45B77
MIISFAEAGGGDGKARFLAPSRSRHLSRRPSVVIRNIRCGGSITGANGLMARSRPDELDVPEASVSTSRPFASQTPSVLKRETLAPTLSRPSSIDPSRVRFRAPALLDRARRGSASWA